MGAGKRRGRGRLSKIELMPRECDDIIAWAAQELADRDRHQTEIYAEFVERCQARMRETRGELVIDIPSYQGFNRYAFKQAQLTRRLQETREIVAAIADKFDAKESDDLTIMAAETMKSLVLHMLVDASGDGIEPKDAMMLASAFRQSVQAQSVSSERRAKIEKAFEGKVAAAVDAAAKTRGLTAETAEKIKADILGVTA